MSEHQAVAETYETGFKAGYAAASADSLQRFLELENVVAAVRRMRDHYVAEPQDWASVLVALDALDAVKS